MKGDTQLSPQVLAISLGKENHSTRSNQGLREEEGAGQGRDSPSWLCISIIGGIFQNPDAQTNEVRISRSGAEASIYFKPPRQFEYAAKEKNHWLE